MSFADEKYQRAVDIYQAFHSSREAAIRQEATQMYSWMIHFQQRGYVRDVAAWKAINIIWPWFNPAL